jgi:pimeloyl-ACP methyl ester carboxylesterase
VADETKNYSAAYDALLEKAQATSNQQAILELKRVGPPPYSDGEGYGVQRKWSNRFEGADQFLLATIGYALTAPGNSVRDLNDSVDGQILSGEHLVDQAKTATFQDLGLEFKVPIFFIQGAEDFTTPTGLAKQYFAMIHAPRKEMAFIQNGGHFAVFMRSNEFLKELLARVSPVIRTR